MAETTRMMDEERNRSQRYQKQEILRLKDMALWEKSRLENFYHN